MNKTLRSLWRQREFSILNVLGLGVGVGSALLIFLLIRNELSIDAFHKNRDRIYRVVSTETYRNGLVDYDGCAPIPLGDALKREFPQVEAEATTYQDWGQLFTLPGATPKKFKENMLYAEPSFFRIFDFAWLSGSPADLSAPYTIVLSRSVAKAWFGRWEDAVGKTVLWRGDHKPLLVTGILEDPPANTDMPVKIIVSFATFRVLDPTEWTDPGQWDSFSGGVQCFFLLRKNAAIGSMNAMLPGFVATHYTPLFATSDTRDSSYFQPLKEMHFNSQLSHYGDAALSTTELWSLGLIGLFLLLVASINFINLATALSVKRSREVGVRKALGGTRGQLFFRFLRETSLLVAFALILGCILAEVSLGPIDRLVQKEISPTALFSPEVLGFLLATGIVVTLLAGTYPGLILSGFNPVGALKNKISGSSFGGLSLRRGLVVLQFMIAQLLIIGTLVVVRQMHYFYNRPMGFDRKAIALMSLGGGIRNVYFKSRVSQVPGVLSATLCNQPPSTDGQWSTGFTLEGHSHPENFEVVRRYGDADYLRTFHLSMLAGRMPYSSDSAKEAVLNLHAVKALGFASPEDILGKRINVEGRDPKYIPVVGVLNDFNNGPLRDKLSPVLLLSDTAQYWTLAVRMDPRRIASVMKAVQALHEQVFPESIYESHFYDEDIVSYYRAEATIAKLFEIFAALAIFISCLGLYGLVSFMAAQKTKEVGIRKVLGASAGSIVYLFSREFTLLVAGAFVVSAPLGWYFMNHWLITFFYHTDVSWVVFVIALLTSVLIAWATVGYRSIRAALADPVKALKYE